MAFFRLAEGEELGSNLLQAKVLHRALADVVPGKGGRGRPSPYGGRPAQPILGEASGA